jgi:hypothetical protein
MSKRFLLFGEKPFEDHAREKFAVVASGIERTSDIEVIMYKENFDELVQRTVKAYAFAKIDISFENKVVDLVSHNFQSQTRFFAEYSLVVKGDTYFLGLSPSDLSYTPMRLPVEVKENILSFEIDTRYDDEELNAEVTARVKQEYERIKDFITTNLENLNETIDYYNSELEKFVIPLLAKKLRKADRCLKIKEALNFK